MEQCTFYIDICLLLGLWQPILGGWQGRFTGLYSWTTFQRVCVNGKPAPNPVSLFSGKPSVQPFASRPSVSYLTAVNHSTAVNACILRPLDGLQHTCGTADRGGGCTWQNSR